MEYVYAALLLHKAGHKVEEGALGKVLEAAGVKPDVAMSKAVVASLDGVDIDKAIKDAAVQHVAVAAAPSGGAPSAGGKHEAKPEAKKEDEKKAAEEAAAGLSALFG
ncbi:MAG: 50S ribosomal protein P1 [Nanoarchaeota archaeon]